MSKQRHPVDVAAGLFGLLIVVAAIVLKLAVPIAALALTCHLACGGGQ
jgi:hypothetical protein